MSKPVPAEDGLHTAGALDEQKALTTPPAKKADPRKPDRRLRLTPRTFAKYSNSITVDPDFDEGL